MPAFRLPVLILQCEREDRIALLNGIFPLTVVSFERSADVVEDNRRREGI